MRLPLVDDFLGISLRHLEKRKKRILYRKKVKILEVYFSHGLKEDKYHNGDTENPGDPGG